MTIQSGRCERGPAGRVQPSWQQTATVLLRSHLYVVGRCNLLARLILLADHTAPVFFWTVIELSLAIMSACLPTLRPLLVRYLPKMLSIWTHPSNASRFGSHFRKHQYVRSESDHADLAMPPTAHVQDLKYGIVRESSFRVDSRPRDMV